ncbi:MAG: DUF1295 domain-containing protein [Microscillaceae bacterium]|jgi:protein-S-isoprenylcysteine O-methyltransferase Ste14|nr:DUF1295 domain-containing protein [Microscillaceae bacterium]
MSQEFFITYILYPWAGVAAVVFLVLQFVSAPYGRHTRQGWGTMIDNRWGWLIMEIISPIVLLGTFWHYKTQNGGLTWFFVALWLGHYLNRSIVFPWRIRTNGKKMPLLIALFAGIFNSVNGFTNGFYLANYGYLYPNDWVFSLQFIVGVALFASGLAINWQADEVLLRLRSATETGYKIPHGGLYRFVSCPNYLGEIIEWLGFALMTASPAAWVFWGWTVANLVPRAQANHNWYRHHFTDYPPKRKAILPFIW